MFFFSLVGIYLICEWHPGWGLDLRCEGRGQKMKMWEDFKDFKDFSTGWLNHKVEPSFFVYLLQ